MVDLNKDTNGLQDAAPTPTPKWVNVVVLGGDTQRLDYIAGMTVGQVMNNANLRLEHGQVITVNGQPATANDVIPANSVVQLTSRVRNGVNTA